MSVLALLERLIPVIYPSMARLFQTKIPPLIDYLKASSENTFNLALWKCKLVSFLDVVLEEAPYWEWNSDLMEELSAQLPSFFHHEHEEGFIFRCLGRCMATCDDTELVLVYLRCMFGSIRFTLTPDHADLVIGFQNCARVHKCECSQVLKEFQGALDAIEKESDNFLDEITPPEHRAMFDIPNFVAERRLGLHR
ncbi:maestro heat-like repeat-containing protein family member 2A isoform X2 [Ambystoma mexicanum]|uniref:maestro heat-like repeat-containing protein family member 2A isoform X2 n=1 Tax=Ambystoma mexicanum TaxID=8296 RepID=UPI0037E86819